MTDIKKLINEYCQTESHYDIPQEFRNNLTTHYLECPRCNGQAVWRSGTPHFENMKRCVKCNLVWSPSAVKTMQRAVASSLESKSKTLFKDLDVGDLFNTKLARQVKVDEENAVVVMSSYLNVGDIIKVAPKSEVILLWTGHKNTEEDYKK